MEKTKTDRGFACIEFTDYYGAGCSIQESSLADKRAIWFGINNADPKIMASKVMEDGVGWVKYPIHEDVLLHTRMHLTQKEVAELLPVLQKFVDTGEI
jgi:hypothetical protein